jgi:glutaredoxin
MYSTSWCGYCKKARKYFQANNIPFVEYDIEKNSRAKKRFDRAGGKGVPLILYKGKRLSGFSESGFNRIYQIEETDG